MTSLKFHSNIPGDNELSLWKHPYLTFGANYGAYIKCVLGKIEPSILLNICPAGHDETLHGS